MYLPVLYGPLLYLASNMEMQFFICANCDDISPPLWMRLGLENLQELPFMEWRRAIFLIDQNIHFRKQKIAYFTMTYIDL